MGVDSCPLRRIRCGIWQSPAAKLEGPRIIRARINQPGVSFVCVVCLQSIFAPRRAAYSGSRIESDPSRSGTGVSSALSLRRLRRSFGFIFICRCCFAGRKSGCSLGTLGQAVDIAVLGYADNRHRHGFLVGLL